MTETSDALSDGFKMTELDPLPEDWEVVRLEEITEKRKETWKPGQEKCKYVALEHIDPGESHLSRFTYSDEVRSAKTRFCQGDILYGKLRPYLDKGILAEFDGICSTDIIVMRPGEKTDKTFLSFFVHSTSFKTYATQTMTGVNHPRTSWKALGNFHIPLPPLPEQHRIAAVLSTVQEAKEKTENVIAATKELKKSLMKHLFSYGPVPIGEVEKVALVETEVGVVPEGWGVVRLGEVAQVKGGKRLPKGHGFSPQTTPYPYIRVVDFSRWSVKMTAIKYLTCKDREKLKRYIITSEDAYISIAGTIGLVGTIPPRIDGANLTENAARLIIQNKGSLDKHFLVSFLASRKGQKEIKLRTSKTSQPKLALARIKQIPIPLPPLHTQQQIADILTAVDRKLEAEENRKKALEELFRTLLGQLMTAKLRVPTLPNVEVPT